MQQHKKIECLMLFVEIAQQLSFTKAAKNLSISRGYLSEQIKKLEAEFKCPLLVRTTRSVRLTAEGEKILTQGKKIKATMLDLDRNVHQEHNAISGALRITAPTLFTERFLLDICHDFKLKYPEIYFVIDSSYINYDLNQDDFDLAFRATSQPPQNMVAKELFSYQHCLCASPEYLAEYGMPENINDLASHHCLSAIETQLWPLKSADVTVKGWLTINDHHLLKQQALAGKGIIRVANYYVDKALKRGTLQRVLENESVPGLSIYVLHPQLIYPSAKLKAFISFVQESLAKQEY
ncbi:LysR family transcriptional regulator [Psychromonas sp. Urea-02u-13]|uniref:LysR family transcriptional regulator n=1 Tax=Psychromonas sp. Urea-02u-13 TaxID=2058326 RepID=UPI000C325206|nr:LysR family transcriptional regulator [Psychromonas sp. Urea-02u-13]PKG40387.1 LysR family transcriptional regulator [Psychromonas sp. Urea-02u-13]